MKNQQEITIRKAISSDSKALALLAGELGYPATISEINTRLTNFSSGLNESVFVAERDFVVGWIHISNIQSLQSEPFAEIRGLVVSEAYQNTGIGTRLVGAAENWAIDKGLTKIRVRTNIKRELTLKFYQNNGYESTKTQKVFDKKLQPV